MLRDKSSRLHQLWSSQGWRVRWPGQAACWGRDGRRFFENAWRGERCGRNWFEGNKQWYQGREVVSELGRNGPRFRSKAPALLGFDEYIDWTCGNDPRNGYNHGAACVQRNYNILSLYAPAAYNTCVNMEWQICAARGELHGQWGDTTIKFAFAPRGLNLEGSPHGLGWCNSYAPSGCNNNYGFASGDIFFLEVCIYSTVCRNNVSLFQVDAGESWHCDLYEDGMDRLKGWMLHD